MSAPRSLQWFDAPGKLNLFLHVLGRRPDGLHELQTVFQLLDVADRVGIVPTDEGDIRFSGEFGSDNLCVRAAKLLKYEANVAQGADIVLEKRLPVGGGMGGGSSDAATVLLVLNRLWNVGWSRERLMALGGRLGADVPAFVFGESALGEGFGERLSALELPPAWYLVLHPQVAVSTKEIFTDPALTRDTKPLKIPPFLSGQGRNDLQAVAVRRYPEIADHLAWLEQQGLRARMTGSGACVFAAFPDRERAAAVHARLPPAMQGFVARGLQRHPLHDWA